jgi:RNA polymerase sigma-70 factor (ECF subfamily)
LVTDDGGPTNSGQPMPVERLSPGTVRALYDVHGRDLLVFLTGVLRNPDAAQDVCQTTFQRLMEAGHEARAETVRGWLFKVAFHEAMAHRRRESRGEQVLRDYRTGRNPADADGTLQSLVVAEDVAKLRQLLGELPAEQRHVVQQRIHEEKTFATIADELNVPLGTVLTRMRLAMQKLQNWFGRNG